MCNPEDARLLPESTIPAEISLIQSDFCRKERFWFVLSPCWAVLDENFTQSRSMECATPETPDFCRKIKFRSKLRLFGQILCRNGRVWLVLSPVEPFGMKCSHNPGIWNVQPRANPIAAEKYSSGRNIAYSVRFSAEMDDFGSF